MLYILKIWCILWLFLQWVTLIHQPPIFWQLGTSNPKSQHPIDISLKLLIQDYSRISLQWRHNDCDGVSNHRRIDCLLNRLSRRNSKETSKLRVTGLCEGNSPVNSPHKGPVTRKMVPFDDVIISQNKEWHKWHDQIGFYRLLVW